MKRKMASIGALLLAATLLALLPAQAQTSSPQETLNQYISDIQKNPNEYALREKIIRHVQTMKPAPATPREAERSMNRGAAAVKSAKDANDFKDAVAEFEKATLSAPWLANAYYNLGVAQDKAGLYAAAIRSLKLYVLAEPNAPDIRSVEKLIDEIEYKQEKAAKESSPATIATKQQNAYEVWLNGLDGARFISAPSLCGSIGHEKDFCFAVYYINGEEVRWGWIDNVRDTRNLDFKTAPIRQMSFNDGMRSKNIQNKKFILPQPSFLTDQRPCTATISDDGQFITELCPSSSVPQTLTRVK